MSDKKNYPEIRNYKQIFHPPLIVTPAPWWDVAWFNVQRAIGWIWLKRKMGKPDPWDKWA